MVKQQKGSILRRNIPRCVVFSWTVNHPTTGKISRQVWMKSAEELTVEQRMDRHWACDVSNGWGFWAKFLTTSTQEMAWHNFFCGTHVGSEDKWWQAAWESEKLDIPGWKTSQKVDRFDLFLSHTWRTKGRWKFLSLLLQSNWPIFLVGWSVGVLVAIPFHLLLDMPSAFSYTCERRSPGQKNNIWNPQSLWKGPGTVSFPANWGLDYESTCSFRVYAHYFGMIGCILGLLLAPYLPRWRPKTCFLDVVSINQANEEQMEQGIYAIGGFLAVSSELRILWDGPFLGGNSGLKTEQTIAGCWVSTFFFAHHIGDDSHD